MNYSQEIHIQRLRLSELDDSLSCFEDILADKISKKYQSARDYPNILIHLAGKTLWTFREIICLCSFGFPEGALSLARNIYEQSITLAFLIEVKDEIDFQNYIEDYYIDADIQRLKVAKWEAAFSLKDSQKEQQYKDELRILKNSAHHKGNGDFWWTGHNTFSNLVEYLLSNERDQSFVKMMTGLHLIYRRACASLHAGSLGNSIRLGTQADFVGVDNSAKAQGHEIPLYFATHSFIPIVGITCHEFNLDGEVIIKKLNELAIFYFKMWHEPREEK